MRTPATVWRMTVSGLELVDGLTRPKSSPPYSTVCQFQPLNSHVPQPHKQIQLASVPHGTRCPQHRPATPPTASRRCPAPLASSNTRPRSPTVLPVAPSPSPPQQPARKIPPATPSCRKKSTAMTGYGATWPLEWATSIPLPMSGPRASWPW